MSHNGHLTVLCEVERYFQRTRCVSIMPVPHPTRVGAKVIQDEIEWIVTRIINPTPMTPFEAAAADAHAHS